MSNHGDLKPFKRLDQVLIERGLAASRSRAMDAIGRGCVTIDGIPATKAAQKVSEDAVITLDDPASNYVSRAALKLISALDSFKFDPTGLNCLDIGASTGGFSQVLLERGAQHVTALDVGHNQLHETLFRHPKITNLEGLNARNLTRDHITHSVEAIVSDVSFISLKLALPPALQLAEPGAFAALLVKPQFEVGKDGIGKGGIVRDPTLVEQTANHMAAWLGDQPGWTVDGLIECPITGSDGNKEFMLGGRYNG